MSITERNTQLQDLRIKLAWLRTEQLAVEQSIKDVNREYKNRLYSNEGGLSHVI